MRDVTPAYPALMIYLSALLPAQLPLKDSPENTPQSKSHISVRQVPEGVGKGSGIVVDGNCRQKQGAHEKRIGILERRPGQSAQKKRQKKILRTVVKSRAVMRRRTAIYLMI